MTKFHMEKTMRLKRIFVEGTHETRETVELYESTKALSVTELKKRLKDLGEKSNLRKQDQLVKRLWERIRPDA